MTKEKEQKLREAIETLDHYGTKDNPVSGYGQFPRDAIATLIAYARESLPEPEPTPLPCPFCGEEPTVLGCNGGYLVKCDCAKWSESKTEAIGAWNHRQEAKGE